MIKTETLLAFVQVAKQSSFTAAAQTLQQTPMAMSKQVSQLERRLGEPLFERTTRKVKLTEFGEQFLVEALKIQQQQEAMEQWLISRHGEVAGTLMLVAQGGQTYQETVFPWLAEFNQLYPKIDLVFNVEESIIDIGKVQADIYWGIGDYLGQQYSGLVRRELWKAKLGIFAAPSYLARFGIPTTPEDLAHHRVIAHSQQRPDNLLIVNKIANSEPVDIEYQLLAASIKTVVGQTILAANGLGLVNALEDNHDVKAYLASGRLVPVLPQYWSWAEIYIYYQQVKIAQPKVRAFIDFFLAKRHLW